MSKSLKQAQDFLAAAKAAGFSVTVTPSVVKIHKTIPVGDKAAFVDADMAAPSILSLAPLKGGSIWGTDGGSVGGHAALTSGKFVMNKSGSGSNFTKALAKLIY